MGALKPRGVLGPIEAEREGRSCIIRVPLDANKESLVLILTNDEARELAELLVETVDA